MDGKSVKPILCELGGTGKLLRRTLAVRTAPPGFREQLLQQLVSGIASGSGVQRGGRQGNARDTFRPRA